MYLVEKALSQINWQEKNILVSCSGGVDSMVLLHALVNAGWKPRVLHVNYQLRGEDSENDQQLVEKTCAALGLALDVHRCPTTLTKAKGVNLQSAARDFRRRLYTEWTAASPKNSVVLAHHADDQLETFFLQYFRGSGIFGLGGMHKENNGIIRPFLEIGREEIRRYAAQKNIAWREDRSNAENNYLRNVLRNELIPALLTQQPALREHALVLTEAFRKEQRELAEKVSETALRWNNSFAVSTKEWMQLTQEEQFTFLKITGMGNCTVEQMNDLCNGNEGRKLMVDDRFLIREKEFIRKIRDASEICWDFKTEQVEILPGSFSNDLLYVDGTKVKVEELRFRPWKTGDRIASTGMKGTQLISDILKDAGVPFSVRALIFVLEYRNDILWIPGYKTGRNGLADTKSEVIVKVSARSGTAV